MDGPNGFRGDELPAADGSRRLLLQIAFTACAVVVAVITVLYVMTSGDRAVTGHAVAGETASDHAKSVRVTSSRLITKEGSNQPKVVLSLYEDFLCPHCAHFEREFGPTISDLIASGTVAADYYMIAILDSPNNQNYSSRAASAAYCVADDSTDAFLRFHSALFANQPDEFSATFPTDSQFAAIARQAGAVGAVADCINGKRYLAMAQDLASTEGVNATPTVRINGRDYELTTAAALARKVTELAGR
ncbi:DsbA family protein [Mycolicibacterium sp. CH28]|uniref:DsbA family protein n=1 Tax=Mycolicibacterium sp. CH28 TaxID=2512237 RepID=UPI001080C3B9|nr:DsbA family protein [Mycolicibacterium sp. CH28]TGD84576.1 DsbA family protein [Mycolicibacterium sp. CH28]